MTNDLAKSVKKAGAFWENSNYYADAEKYVGVFWRPTTIFFQQFRRLDLSNVIELACGHGRHAECVVDLVGHLTLMDIHESNLEACRRRLASKDNVSYYLINGADFKPIADKTISAIFCYDAMVHFEADVVQSYLVDTARVLAPGGMALYHHSNYNAPGGDWGRNPHARNHMTFDLFSRYVNEARLRILSSEVIEWGGKKNLDRLSLVTTDR